MRRVEEGREQLVAEVVVGADVLARPLQGVLLVRRHALVDDRPQPLQRLRHQGGEPGRERRQQVGQVGAGPAFQSPAM